MFNCIIYLSQKRFLIVAVKTIILSFASNDDAKIICLFPQWWLLVLVYDIAIKSIVKLFVYEGDSFVYAYLSWKKLWFSCWRIAPAWVYYAIAMVSAFKFCFATQVGNYHRISTERPSAHLNLPKALGGC